MEGNRITTFKGFQYVSRYFCESSFFGRPITCTNSISLQISLETTDLLTEQLLESSWGNFGNGGLRRQLVWNNIMVSPKLVVKNAHPAACYSYWGGVHQCMETLCPTQKRSSTNDSSKVWTHTTMSLEINRFEHKPSYGFLMLYQKEVSHKHHHDIYPQHVPVTTYYISL